MGKYYARIDAREQKLFEEEIKLGEQAEVGKRVYMATDHKYEDDGMQRRMKHGTVAWIHPKGRFAMIQFDDGLRESFALINGRFVR